MFIIIVDWQYSTDPVKSKTISSTINKQENLFPKKTLFERTLNPQLFMAKSMISSSIKFNVIFFS